MRNLYLLRSERGGRESGEREERRDREGRREEGRGEEGREGERERSVKYNKILSRRHIW